MKRILVIGLAVVVLTALPALVLLGRVRIEPITELGSLIFGPTPAPALVKVYQKPECYCCGEYAAYLENEGYQVEVIYVKDRAPILAEYRISPVMRSCHTAVVEGYFVEGHVPVEEIEKLLAAGPAIAGIALPGMPSGSPGMPGPKTEEFEIYAVLKTQIIENVTPEEAYALLQDNRDSQNFVIIDVRTPQEYAGGHIAEAINLDYYSKTFEDELGKLDKNKTYLIYCRSGRRSGTALGMMEKLGFGEVYNLRGGIVQWQAAGLPVIK